MTGGVLNVESALRAAAERPREGVAGAGAEDGEGEGGGGAREACCRETERVVIDGGG